MGQPKNEPISRRDPEVKVEPGAPSPEQLKMALKGIKVSTPGIL